MALDLSGKDIIPKGGVVMIKVEDCHPLVTLAQIRVL